MKYILEVHIKKFRGLEIRVSALEGSQQKQTEDEYISEEQIKILQEKVKEKGIPISVWCKFNKYFNITRYKFLLRERFEEALAWIESYTENP